MVRDGVMVREGVLVREDVMVRDGVWVRQGVLSEKCCDLWLWLGARELGRVNSVQRFDPNLPIISSSDMGLGKTLQSICMLAGDHAQRKNAPEVMDCICLNAHTVLPPVECSLLFLLVECPMCASYYVLVLCIQVSLGSPLEGVLPSLVVCPPTLTGHWCYEVDKFCPSEHLKVLHYAGNIGERLM